MINTSALCIGSLRGASSSTGAGPFLPHYGAGALRLRRPQCIRCGGDDRRDLEPPGHLRLRGTPMPRATRALRCPSVPCDSWDVSNKSRARTRTPLLLIVPADATADGPRCSQCTNALVPGTVVDESACRHAHRMLRPARPLLRFPVWAPALSGSHCIPRQSARICRRRAGVGHERGGWRRGGCSS